MSVKVAGFQASDVFAQIKAGLESGSDAEKQARMKKANAVFQFDVASASGQKQSWTLDLKKTGSVTLGAAEKADIVISVKDSDFVDLANGKATGQKLFMSGKVKVKGQMMLATKLDAVLKDAKKGAKL